jgi:hypothetical protein
VDCAQGRSGPGDDQAAAGVAIKAMGEFERFVRTQGPERLDDAKCQPGSAMHCKSRWLAQREYPLVLVDDGRADQRTQRIRNARRQWLSRRRLAHRRQPDFIVRRQPIVRARAFAVHPDLTPAQQAIDAASRHTLEFPQQEVVEPLAVSGGARPDAPDAARRISALTHRGFLKY